MGYKRPPPLREHVTLLQNLKAVGTLFLPDTSGELDRRLHNEARKQGIAIKVARWVALHPSTLEIMRVVRVDLTEGVNIAANGTEPAKAGAEAPKAEPAEFDPLPRVPSEPVLVDDDVAKLSQTEQVNSLLHVVNRNKQ